MLNNFDMPRRRYKEIPLEVKKEFAEYIWHESKVSASIFNLDRKPVYGDFIWERNSLDRLVLYPDAERDVAAWYGQFAMYLRTEIIQYNAGDPKLVCGMPVPRVYFETNHIYQGPDNSEHSWISADIRVVPEFLHPLIPIEVINHDIPTTSSPGGSTKQTQ